ncbi:MAG: Rab family GTPase, partial [Candidatus Hodarchaeota archaeon]
GIGGRTMSDVKKYTVVFVGAWSSGKTSVRRRLKEGDFKEIEPPTIGVAVDDTENGEIEIIEIGGQEGFEELLEKLGYKKGADLFIYIIDSTRESDFKRYFEFIQRHSEIENLIILINKMDLKQQIVSKYQEHIQHLKHPYYECSAKTGEGFIEIEEELIFIDDWRKEPEMAEPEEEPKAVYSEAEIAEAKRKAQEVLKKHRAKKE